MSASRDESGIAVYPQLPVPPVYRGEPRQAPRRGNRRITLAVAAAAIAGGIGAWFLHPIIAPDGRIADAVKRAADADSAAGIQKARADALEKSFDAASKAKRDTDAKLAVAEAAQAELASKTADEATQRAAVTAVQGKLKAALDRAADAITVDGADVHVRLADRLLFKPADDALTDRGKAVLAKLAVALKQMPDQLVWVQGHSNEQSPPARPAPPPPATRHGKAAPAAPAPATPRFATSWELSAGRAVAVVRYLQDTAKLDPSRLAALAFGPYAPVSAKDKAANRRVEIVLRAKKPAR